jgi:hypothetical protein
MITNIIVQYTVNYDLPQPTGPKAVATHDSGEDQDHTALIARPPRATKRRRPALSAIPDERPATKRRTIMRAECDTAASIVRNQRLDERLNVNNGVISGRTF